MRLLHPLRLVVFLLLACASAATASAKPAPWLKIEAPDFVLYSNASERDAVACAVRYAAFRHTFRTLFVAPGRTLPPSVLIVFRTSREFDRYANSAADDQNRRVTVHYHAEIDGTPYSTFAVGGDRDRAMRFTFEFETIWGMGRLGYYVPLWMGQGAGEILSGMEIDHNRCVIGASDRSFGGETIPWAKFFAVNSESKLYRDNDTLSDYLAQARGLMHWILFNDDQTRARVADLALRLRTNDTAEAVAQAMATPPDHFVAEIRSHFRHGRFPVALPFDAAVCDGFRIGPPAEAERLARLSDLLAAGQRFDEANAELDRARALDPESSVVKEAWARRMDREGRPDEAVRLYREALAAGSKNVYALLRSATGHLDDMQTGGRDFAGEGGEAAATAVEELRAAIALDPGSTDAWRMLGRAFFVLPQVTDDHLAELARGLQPGAAGLDIRLYHALVAKRLGHFDLAMADLQQNVDEPNATLHQRDEAHRQRAWLRLERDQPRILAFANAGDFAAARQLIDAADAAGDHDATVDATYRELARSIDEADAWARLRPLVEGSRWAELRDAAHAFVEKFPTGPHRREARRLEKEAGRHLDAAAPKP